MNRWNILVCSDAVGMHKRLTEQGIIRAATITRLIVSRRLLINEMLAL